MQLKEMKKKVLGLIEELNPKNQYLTDDPDIQAKINDVINMVQYELARMKKLPSYVEIEVNEGDVLTFASIKDESGFEVYQLSNIKGVDFDLKAQGTMIKFRESGVAEIDFFRYPKRITDESTDDFEFDLSNDILEIMPYGVAGDILKSDVSAAYGENYSARFESMLSRLDHRYITPIYRVEGGVDV